MAVMVCCINDKICSLSTKLTATDQKLQKNHKKDDITHIGGKSI